MLCGTCQDHRGQEGLRFGNQRGWATGSHCSTQAHWLTVCSGDQGLTCLQWHMAPVLNLWKREHASKQTEVPLSQPHYPEAISPYLLSLWKLTTKLPTGKVALSLQTIEVYSQVSRPPQKNQFLLFSLPHYVNATHCSRWQVLWVSSNLNKACR